MPIYEFHCQKCGRDSEVLLRSSRWQGTSCPHCGSRKLSKKLSVFASSSSTATADACPIAAGGAAGGCGGCCGGGPHRH